MGLHIITSQPEALLKKIKDAIDKGHITTWSYDEDGDFTHTPLQWKKKAWLTPKIGNNELRFGLVGQEETIMLKEVYAVYHGRFSEMLLAHFDNDFTEITQSAVGNDDDHYDTE